MAPLVGTFRFNLTWNILTCENMYLGTVYVSTKFRPDRTSNMAAMRRPSWKTNSRAIDMQLCSYVPLGNRNSQTKFRSSPILNFSHQGAKTEDKGAMTPELMAGSS
jgi:hypothetical protein